MESCVLPIELCEKVMDAIPEYFELPDIGSGWTTRPKNPGHSQRALCACALTCHAWRVRAQYLLWTFPSLIQCRKFPRFNTAIRKSLHTPTISGLALGSLDVDHKASDLSTAGELFMHSFPHLRSLVCDNIAFERGPPLRVFRMRLPFFDSITFLIFFNCTFQSLRAMLDVVWACSNLAALAIDSNVIKSERCSAAGFQNLCSTAENLRACRKLTSLLLDSATMQKYWTPSDNIGISGVGRIFGYAVTELVFHTGHTPEVFISLFRDSFPALRSVTVLFGGLDENPEFPSWLHVIISTGRPVPGILKTIFLSSSHDRRNRECCKRAVGTSEEVVGSTQRLPELLPELAELVFRLVGCYHPARHAAYLWDVLPRFRNVLRFEYCVFDDGDWNPYTVVPQDVPRLLAQDSDSGSH